MAYNRMSLDGWTNMFDDIYGKRNQGLLSDQVLHRLIEEVSELVKPVLTFNFEQIKDALPDVFAWTCAFSKKMNISLDEVMKTKYLAQLPGKKGQPPLDIFPIIDKDRPENMQDWQKYLDYTYKEENINNTPDLMLTRLVEDLGKTSRSLRKHADTKDVGSELSGILAWTFGISNKFRLSLQELVWNKYPNACFKCRNQKCTCSNFSSVFLSYCGDTKESKDKLKAVIKSAFPDITVKDFEETRGEFSRMRMVEMIDTINKSDAGIVIFDREFSPYQYAEFIEILRVMDEKNKFVYVKVRRDDEREKELGGVLTDAKHFQKLTSYENDGDLLKLVNQDIKSRLEEIKKG